MVGVGKEHYVVVSDVFGYCFKGHLTGWVAIFVAVGHHSGFNIRFYSYCGGIVGWVLECASKDLFD